MDGRQTVTYLGLQGAAETNGSALSDAGIYSRLLVF
jgi:hypothetical protein